MGRRNPQDYELPYWQRRASANLPQAQRATGVASLVPHAKRVYELGWSGRLINSDAGRALAGIAVASIVGAPTVQLEGHVRHDQSNESYDCLKECVTPANDPYYEVELRSTTGVFVLAAHFLDIDRGTSG